MKDWKPITLIRLEELIETAVCEMSDGEKQIWSKIKLAAPQKWQNHPMGNTGNGFWVVAIYGTKCLYYNDIEDGFNESSYSNWGEISEYACNQTELHHVIRSTFQCKSQIDQIK